MANTANDIFSPNNRVIITGLVLGSEEQEIEIYRKAYDSCLGLLCPVCMSECRALAYFAMNIVKLRAGMIKEDDLINDELFGEAIVYIKAFFDGKKDFIDKIINKNNTENNTKEGEFTDHTEGEFVEENKS